MEKDANERYRHAHEFAADLRACLNELGVQRADTERPSRMDKSPGTAPGGGDKTEKWRVGDDGAAGTAADAGMITRSAKPQNIILDSNTRLALGFILAATIAGIFVVAW